MIRKARTAVYKATKRSFPLTWKRCRKCGRDFKLEPSYVYTDDSIGVEQMRLCRDCSRELVSGYPDANCVNTWDEETKEKASQYFGQEAAKAKTDFFLAARPGPLPPQPGVLQNHPATVSGVAMNPFSYAEKLADGYFNKKAPEPVKLEQKKKPKTSHVKKNLTLRG